MVIKMDEVERKIMETKQQLKDLKKLKKMQHKLWINEMALYKPHPYYAFLELLYSLVELVKKPND